MYIYIYISIYTYMCVRTYMLLIPPWLDLQPPHHYQKRTCRKGAVQANPPRLLMSEQNICI